MGVPVFFKWLSMRNPKIIKDALQLSQQSFQSGNPQIDNFYIDMNGLIHPSCNPKGQNIKQPSNFEEQCENIYEYIDKLMNIVRPKSLLYLAIDGVAPRAKMNQQRSRRFRAAMEGSQMKQKKQKLIEQYRKMGAATQQVQNYVSKQSFDSNMITPGTVFLTQICKKLRQYIRIRLTQHKFWRNLTVVFSDSNCPGEGQHKIMDFIRQQRSSQGYSPNQSHCIYGADADLIMLTLATHEPRFFVIRQIVITANDKWCTSCGQKGHFFLDCIKADSIQNQQKVNEIYNANLIRVNFQFIRIQMARQYLHLQFHKVNIPFGYNLQRIIDDFIFLCFFVGNDFLPHIPCLSIREGGIDVLMRVYEYCLEIMPDYLTSAGQVNLFSLQIFIKQMGYYQQSLINQMISKQTSQKIRQNFQKKIDIKKSNSNQKNDELKIDYRQPLTSFKQQLKKLQNQQNSLEDYSVFGHNIYSYKQKYYRQKFKIKPYQFVQLKNNISKCYVQALRWVCYYYYKGVPSWSWFYPFHYSPFFTDLKVSKCQPFDLGKPFTPFQQLMAVLPPKTSQALPKKLQHLMLDPQSPICDYFPKYFTIDLIGKKFAWLGQVLLPFIDDERLLNAMGNYHYQLNNQQQYRNRIGQTYMYISKYGNLGRLIASLIQINHSMAITQQTNNTIQGEIKLLTNYGEVFEYIFIQPQNRIHKIQLKQGIRMSYLEELNDQYVSRTDKKAFGGERFLRVIDRILGKRFNEYKRYQPRYNQKDNNKYRKNNERNKEQKGSRSRSRSRENKKYHNQNNNNNNQYRNRNYKRKNQQEQK